MRINWHRMTKLNIWMHLLSVYYKSEQVFLWKGRDHEVKLNEVPHVLIRISNSFHDIKTKSLSYQLQICVLQSWEFREKILNSYRVMMVANFAISFFKKKTTSSGTRTPDSCMIIQRANIMLQSNWYFISLEMKKKTPLV